MADKKVASLYADLDLRINAYLKNLNKAISQSQTAAKKINKSMGTLVPDNTGAQLKYMKDVSRVVSGIVISQAFYRGLHTINQAVEAVSQFSQNMEVARVSFSILLGSEEKARNFLEVLEDFAAVTPFTMEQAKNSAQQLLAMGYQAKSIIPTLRTILDAAAISGAEPETLERIVLAMGKIKSTGFLSAREVISLAKARVPIIEILREELNLTDKQLKNVGKLAIKSDVAIKAILSGMEKRFGGATALISRTLPGLISTIKDNLLFMAGDVTKGMYENVRWFAEKLAAYLTVFRRYTKKSGVGGLMDAIIPPELMKSIRLVGEAFKRIAQSIGRIFIIYGRGIQTFLQLALTLTAAVLPAIAAFIDKLTLLWYWLDQNIPFIKYLVAYMVALQVASIVAISVKLLAKAIAMLNVAAVVSTAIKHLIKDILILSAILRAHPIILIMTGIGIAAAKMAMSFDGTRSAIDKVSTKLKDFFGIKGDSFQPLNGADATANADEYNEAFGSVADSAKNVGDEAKEAAKKVKNFIAGFDEVVNIPDASGADSGIGDIAEDLEDIGDISANGLDLTAIKLPELGNMFSDFVTPLKEAFAAVWDFLAKGWETAKDIIANWDAETTKQLIDWSANALKWFVTGLGEVVKYIGGWVVEFLGKIFVLDEATKKQFKETFNKVVDLLVSWSVNLIDETAKGLKAVIDLIYNWGADSVKAFADWGSNVSKEFVDWSAGILNTVGSLYADFMQWLGAWDEDTTEGFKQWLAGSLAAVADWVKMSLDKFNEFWDATVDLLFKWNDVTVADINKWVADVLLILGGWVLDTILIFAGMDEDARASFKEAVRIWYEIFKEFISSTMTDVKQWVLDIPQKFVEMKDKAVDAITGIKIGVQAGWAGLGAIIKGEINSIIDRINEFISLINDMDIKIPKVDLPGGGSVGGGTIGFPDIKKIPHLAKGGIVKKDSIVRVAEKHVPEAVVPLSESGMAPLVNAIADVVADIVDSLQQGQEQLRPLYVGTLIADDRSLKQLERKMEVIRLQEQTRKGGAV